MHEVREDNRESAASRGYDGRWAKLRLRYLNRHPLCERCMSQGSTTLAGVVHHKVPISDGGARLDARNLMAVCRECHEIIHGRKKERC